MENIEMPYVEDFLRYLNIYKDASSYTINNYKVDLKYFFEFTKGKYDVNIRKINSFTEYLLYDKGDARSTINRRLSTLKSYYRYLYNEEVIDKPLFEKITYVKQEEKVLKAIINQERVFKILDKIDDVRDRAMMETLYSTGIREGELSKLDIPDIDFENELVFIKGKRKKYRIVPISSVALEWIKAYIGNRTKGPLFLNNRYHRIGTRGIYNICKKYFSMGPHQLRHAFATHLAAEGVSTKAISEMLGHADEKTTERIYTHLASNYLSQIYKGTSMNRDR